MIKNISNLFEIFTLVVGEARWYVDKITVSYLNIEICLYL